MIENIMGVEIRALTGEQDERCPSARNLPFFTQIAGSESQELVGIGHEDFTGLNDGEFVRGTLSQSLTQVSTTIEDPAICTIKPAYDCSKSPDKKRPECKLIEFEKRASRDRTMMRCNN